MARIRDLGNVWKTIRELDIQAIREEAEQPLRIVVVGVDETRAPVVRLLREAGAGRFAGARPDPLLQLALPLSRERSLDISQADLLILALRAGQPLNSAAHLAYEKLQVVDAPLLVVLLDGSELPSGSPGMPAPEWSGQRVISLGGPAEHDRLASAVLELLPEELQLAAARRLPGLRAEVARTLISETSVSNATYALSSGIPEMIPLLSLPLAAADILVLTKNQALLIYRLALALGAPADFSAQMQEIMPVIGGAFIWRQLARELIGLIPGFGLVPKVAVAYAGTYAVGVAAWRWYSWHEKLSRGALKGLMREALQDGRARALELLARYRPQGGRLGRLASRVRRLLPRRRPATAQGQASDRQA